MAVGCRGASFCFWKQVQLVCDSPEDDGKCKEIYIRGIPTLFTPKHFSMKRHKQCFNSASFKTNQKLRYGKKLLLFPAYRATEWHYLGSSSGAFFECVLRIGRKVRTGRRSASLGRAIPRHELHHALLRLSGVFDSHLQGLSRCFFGR